MPIRCPTCLSVYDPPPELLAGQGSILRCAHCRHSLAVVDNNRAEQPFVSRMQRHDGPEIVAEARSARPVPVPPSLRPSPRRLRASAKPHPSRSAAIIVLAVLGILASAMAAVARKDLVVRFYPPSAGLFEAVGLPVNLRGLAFADMHGTVTAQGSRPVLTLQGKISNLRGVTTAIPALRIAVRDKAHNELYSWTAPAPKPRLGAGETVVFRSRLAAPPADGQDLVVSFAENAGVAPQDH